MIRIKKLLLIGLLLIALVALGATLFFNKLDGLIADAIKTEGTLTLGVAVDVGRVSTDLKQGSASVFDLTIANPNGFSKQSAFTAAHLEAVVNYQEQSIDSISINEPTIYAELIGSNNNFQALLENMPPASPTDASSANSDDQIILSIKKIEITRGTINLNIIEPELGERQFVMDDLVMRDLHGNIDQLGDEILSRLSQHVSGQVSRYAQDQLKASAKDKIKQKLEEKLGDKLKGLGL
ncbi:hypothetical protein [Arenicella xantha]|uniref:AsmA-like protein n=1 Tax=Arenicella xantha TaxID=644221 RepID=A0A395JK55_9GAMM|nr:hypothetical protein [Arenicella xantha]RBP51163.1 hypothetical protein DFR28_102582 [Arenicella xantha]